MKSYRVKIRRNLAEVKPEAEQIDNQVYMFYPGWNITKDESSIYAGEVAMIPRDEKYPRDAPIWIASGDLEEQRDNS